jgi:hypothetical protein
MGRTTLAALATLLVCYHEQGGRAPAHLILKTKS